MAKDYEVMVVNPGTPPRRRRRRKAATAGGKRRRRNPGFPAARRGPSRRSNPSFMGLNVGYGSAITDAALRLVGKVIGAWAVRRIGSTETDQISGGASPTTGLRWSFWNHVVCIGAGVLAGGLIGSKRAGWGQKIFEGALDLSVQKAFWSEVVHRTESGPKWLGAPDEGDVREANGRTAIFQNGRWVTMMGLSEKTALDGLVEAGAMGRRQRAMGHLLPAEFENTPADRQGRYQRSASTSPYHSAYRS